MGNNSYIGKILSSTKAKLATVYHYCKAKRLHNTTPTIIGNNCVAGVMYHDLGLQFLSPTINLYILPCDFILFLNHLDEFLNSDFEEVYEDGVQFPIGLLRAGDKQVKIYFMHYHSYEEAIMKWNARKERIQKDNLFVVFEYPGIGVCDAKADKIMGDYAKPPFKNKVMLTGRRSDYHENVVVMDFYDETHFPGKILKYKGGRFSVKRYLDDFDYISFLNKE